MRRAILPIAAVAADAALSVAIMLAPSPAQAATRPRPPIVVELFTAQGCTGCPEANRLLEDVAAQPGVLTLTFSVDYWDYTGWKDTFAKPEFTTRQRAYATRMKVREIYTPEVVVGGRKEALGGDRKAVQALIDAQAARPVERGPVARWLSGGTRIQLRRGRDDLGGADVWLVRFDPQEQDVRVKTGDNKGKLVPQTDVVRSLVRLGGFTGRTKTYTLPEAKDANLQAKDTSLRSVVIVQGVRGGPIFTVTSPPP